jgi:hypothetical protein
VPAETAEIPAIAHTPVHPRPLKTNSGFACVLNDLLCKLQLGPMNLLRSRNICAFATTRIVSPFLRQVQPSIDQANSIASA